MTYTYLFSLTVLFSCFNPSAPCYLFCNGLMDHLCLCANLGSPFRPFPHAPHPPFDSTLVSLRMSALYCY